MLAKTFFFFALMPFVSPYPIGTDVQPVALVLAGVIFLLDLVRNRVRLTAVELYFFALALFALGFIGMVGEFNIRYRVGLLSAFLVYHAVVKHHRSLTGGVLTAAASVTFGGVLWHYLSPATFVPVARLFVRTIKITEIGTRGASGFAAENSFSAALALAYILLALYLKERASLSERRFRGILVMSGIVVLLSQSALGYLFALLLLGGGLFLRGDFRQQRRLIGVAIVAAVVFVNSPFMNTRGGQLISALIANPQVLLLDGSTAQRINGIHTGILSLLHYPFGAGGGAYATVALELDQRYRIMSYYPNALHGNDVTASAAAFYVVDFGVFFLALLAALLWQSVRWRVFPMLASVLATLYVLVTFSITFPPTYLLFGLASVSVAEAARRPTRGPDGFAESRP